ncbi:MAG: transaldolase [Candidatus Dormibacteria bacterium]
MKPTQALQDLGQSLWLDNITRELLQSGTLAQRIQEYGLSGLTSNPSIFDQAIESSSDYDQDIGSGLEGGDSAEAIFFRLAIQDLRAAADLFAPIHQRTAGVDGWVSLEVSPELAYQGEGSAAAARRLHRQAERDNLFIKIPGNEAGLGAIEESIFAGIPINVTLLFSAEQYLAAAQAYMRGLERRVEAGLSPDVASVASLFVSRWDKAVSDRVPERLRDRIGIAAAQQTYRAYRELLDSARWQRLANLGARPQRALWASTSTKDPEAPDTLYVAALAAPLTINTMPDQTLLAFADHGVVGESLGADGGQGDSVMAQLAEAGIDPKALALQLQREGAEAFERSWKSLLACIEGKAAQLSAAS